MEVAGPRGGKVTQSSRNSICPSNKSVGFADTRRRMSAHIFTKFFSYFEIIRITVFGANVQQERSLSNFFNQIFFLPLIKRLAVTGSMGERGTVERSIRSS